MCFLFLTHTRIICNVLYCRSHFKFLCFPMWKRETSQQVVSLLRKCHLISIFHSWNVVFYFPFPPWILISHTITTNSNIWQQRAEAWCPNNRHFLQPFRLLHIWLQIDQRLHKHAFQSKISWQVCWSEIKYCKSFTDNGSCFSLFCLIGSWKRLELQLTALSGSLTEMDRRNCKQKCCN